MATSRITIRTIDYHKYRSLVVDRAGSADDRDRCDREMSALCEAVRRLHDRDDCFREEDDEERPGTNCRRRREGDRARLDEICGWYKLILESRRVRSVDVRLRSGWWDGRKTDKHVSTAGRLRSNALRESLVEKTSDWLRRHGAAGWLGVLSSEADIDRKLDKPGVFVFLHRHRRCFQLVGRAPNVFTWCSDALREAFDGSSPDPLSALLVTSVSHDWDFYFMPAAETDSDSLLRILENDTILKHDSIWPYGLNVRLNVSSFVELTHLRASCRRHRWPPSRDADFDDDVIDIDQPHLIELRLKLNEYRQASQPDDVDQLENHVDEAELPDGPASAMTFVDIVKSSTVKMSRGRRRANSGSSSDDSSLGSTITATTVRTAIHRSTPPPSPEVLQDGPSDVQTSTTPREKARSEIVQRTTTTSRSTSRPASARPRTLAQGSCGARARSVSHSGQRSASLAGTAAERRRLKASEYK